MLYRVYLKEWSGWREFGIDYPTRQAATEAANRYRAAFPHLTYIVRGGHFSRISQFFAD